MKFYLIRFGLNGGANQAELMGFLKSNGSAVIQLSDGICIKSPLAADAFVELLRSKFPDLKPQSVSPAEVAADEAASPDLKAFVTNE